MRTRFLLLSAMLAASCRTAPHGGGGNRPWSRARHFACQFQDLDLGDLSSSPFDLLAIDPLKGGGGAWTRDEIAAVQGSPRKRLVLAYLSIGEAETYRPYWRPEWKASPPPWLEAENPDWPGNFKVRYWDARWRGIVLNSLDGIMDAGFDGVFLDVVDAFRYFEDRGRSGAREEMKALVLEVARHARRERGQEDFGVFPLNGEALLEDPEFREAVTGAAREDIYFGFSGEGIATPPDVTAMIEERLRPAVRSGKPVLSIDYTRKEADVRSAYRRARRRGYLEYCAGRMLDRLWPQPWFPGK